MLMKKIALLFISFLMFQYGFAQKNLELKANVTYNERLSDVWGYSDSLGNEYAIVCLNASISIENITNPSSPQNLGRIEAPRSIWRDAKTYGKFAYFTNESSGGVQILNLENLPNSIDSSDSKFWSPLIPGLGKLNSCHNIYIDTLTGLGFLAGCNINNGGILIVDLFTNPGTPAFVAAAAPVYSHDVYTRGDFIYSSDVYGGYFSIQNMANLDSIYIVSRQNTPFNFTHNAWLSDDGNTLFTTDERGDAPIGAYDISDMNDIKFLDEFRPLSSLNQGLIPHNVHVKNDFLVTSFYTEGVIITDAHRPDNLIEVGNYDTDNGPIPGFNGTWGAYPFFDSDLILATDIRNGLFIFEPTYVRACYLEGVVKDSLTGDVLEGVAVQISSPDLNQAKSDASGTYKTGQASSGTFQVTYSKEGYVDKILTVQLENGAVTLTNVELVQKSSFPENVSIITNTVEGCAPLQLDFTPSFNDASVQYRWVIMGSDTSKTNSTNLALELNTAGDYTIVLTRVLANDSLVTLDQKSVKVLAAPTVHFEVEIANKTISLHNATEDGNNYKWKFGDGNSSEEVSPVHTYLSDGEYLIELTAFNACSGTTSSQSISIMTTSLNELLPVEVFSAQPNPFKESIHLNYKLSTVESPLFLMVRDLLGREKSRIPLKEKKGLITLGANWEQGLYFIQIVNNKAISRPLKVIKYQ
jgi:choice-of-anchor B domain-containing protein